MITVQQLRRAKGIEGDYAAALSEGASEYYASQRGVWCGKGAERIHLPAEVSKEDLIAVCNNEVGRVDPHWHCYCLLMNATYDVEGRWKAAQLGSVVVET